MTGRVYDTARWKRVRLRKLAETPWCEALGCTSLGEDVDHLDGDTGNWAWDNLCTMCHSCHSAKTQRCDRPTSPCTKPMRGHGPDGLPIDGAWR